MMKKGQYVTSYSALCLPNSNNVEKVNRNQTDANIRRGCCRPTWLLSNFTAKLCKLEFPLSRLRIKSVLSSLGYIPNILRSRFLFVKLIFVTIPLNANIERANPIEKKKSETEIDFFWNPYRTEKKLLVVV